MKITTLFLSFIIIVGCRAPRSFQIECNSVSEDAIYSVDVTIESKKELADLGEVKLAAIDEVLFKGISGANCITQKPMLSKVKTEVISSQLYKDIYGKKRRYEKYVNSITPISSSKELKNSSQLYQFKYRVKISKDLLRNDLIEAGLQGSLNSIF